MTIFKYVFAAFLTIGLIALPFEFAYRALANEPYTFWDIAPLVLVSWVWVAEVLYKTLRGE
jgi:hypothetical protein